METLPCSAGTQKTVCKLYVLRGSATVCFCKAFLKKSGKHLITSNSVCLIMNPNPKTDSRRTINSDKKDKKSCNRWYGSHGALMSRLQSQFGITWRDRINGDSLSFSKKYDNMSKILFGFYRSWYWECGGENSLRGAEQLHISWVYPQISAGPDSLVHAKTGIWTQRGG